MREGWVVKPVGEMFETVTGGTPPKREKQLYGDHIPLVKPPELIDGPISSASDNLSRQGAEVARVLPVNSILVSCIGNLGKIGINTVPVAFNQQINAIKPREDIANPWFMFYQMLSPVFSDNLTRLASGTTVPIVNKSKFNSILVAIPPLPEQKRIVAILDEAFEGIGQAVKNAEKNLANARELFESYLNFVFTQKGEGWVEKKLSSLMDISHGFAFKGPDFKASSNESKPIVLTPGNYTENGKLYFIEKNTKRFSGDIPDAYLFEVGDLTVVMTDLSSKMKILGKPAFINRSNILHNQRIGRVIFKDSGIIPRFVYYFFRTREVSDKIKETSTGTMVRHTAPKRILAFILSFPSRQAEQAKIVSALDSMSAETNRLEAIYQQKLTALAELKQSLLQKAFAGELTAEPDVAIKEEAVA